IWSDVVCPFCYLGKRRLEKALAAFKGVDEVDIVWRSYLLDPSAPEEPVESVAEALGRKYGGGVEAGQRMVDQMQAAAAEEGMVWRHGEASRVGTKSAHRLLHLAHAEGAPGVQNELKEALLHAYFIDAENVADHDLLRRFGLQVGLPAARVDAVLAGDEFTAQMWADIDQAHAYGVSGVPFFVIDQKFAIAGAQPVETFVAALEKARAAAQPQLSIVEPEAAADVCGTDGCTT
ncbi:MAG: DsbA family oxidoreductase, partial [Nocardioidaceae bacterium]|nr:DsbA family oxidoreductase [Nocardioidaceae bacterium]